MTTRVRIPTALWQEITDLVSKLVPGELSWPPIVFALYGREDDHLDIMDYRRIETVKARGEDDYYYPGIKKQGFYPPRGTGKWFSGTLVVGGGLDLDDSYAYGSDRYWMIRDQMDFRIKMHRNSPTAPWSYKVYVLDISETALQIT